MKIAIIFAGLVLVVGGCDHGSTEAQKTEAVTKAFGGYVQDLGPDTRSVHLALDAEAFLGVAVLLDATLLSLGLSEELYEELVLAIASRALPVGSGQ